MNTATLDHAAGAAAKHAGMQLALTFSGDWKDEILSEFRAWIAAQKARGETVITIERFRSQAKNQPASHYAWGSMPAIAMAAGLIEPKWAAPGVQDRVRAASVRTHGHEVKCWAVL